MQARELKGCEFMLVCCYDTAGVLVGLISLGEQLPPSLLHRLMRWSGWTCITLGLTSLAGALNSVRSTASSMLQKAPILKQVVSRVPKPLMMSLNWTVGWMEAEAYSLPIKASDSTR